MIELGLRTLLLSHGTLTSLAPAQVVEGVRYDAVFNEWPTQGFGLPFILISVIDGDSYGHLGGTTGLASSDIDVDCYARTFPAARRLSHEVAEYLKDYRGGAGADDYIEAVIWDGSTRHDKIFDNDGRDVRQHIVSLSFQIQHKPAR